MADVAQLGLSVDSSGVTKATADLNRLSNAAKVAENASKGLASASGRMNSSQIAAMAQNMGAVTRESNAAARALAAQSLAAQKAASSAKAHAAAVNDNYAKMRSNTQRFGGSMSGLAAQAQDVAVTAAMGMNPLIIALQQGTQIAGQMEMAMASGATATGVFAQAFRSLLSPISLAAIALTAVAAAALQMVNWSGLAASALNGLADVLQTIAPYAAGAAAGLAILYAPAIIGGTVQLIALLGRLSVAALGLAASFAAANPAVAFVIGITAAVAAANIFREELTQIFGTDIVGAAKTGVNYIIGSFVAAFEDIKFVWNNLPNIVGAAAVGAANAAIRAINHMINGAKMAINDLISAINVIPGVDIGALDTSGGAIGELENNFAAQLSEGVAARNSAGSSALSKDYLGGFGAAIAKGASAASSKLKELAKDITAVDDKTKKKGGGATEAEKYSDIVDGANRRIASLKAEQAALGMTEQAALALKYETDLLNEAQQKGITLTAAQRAELSGLAAEMSSTEIATKKAKEAMDFAKDAAKGFISDLRSGLMNGEGFWKSFGDAAMNVLDKIISKIEGQLVDALFSVGGVGSGGGLFGSLFGGLFGGGGQMAIAMGGGVGLYASGTASARAGMAIVGEQGPELVRFKGGEKVVPNHQLRAANSNSSGDQSVSFNMTLVLKGTGDKELLEQARKGAEMQMTQALSNYNRLLPDYIARANRNPSRR